MGTWKQSAILVVAILACAFAKEDDRRHKKAIGIFNVVQFPNDACDADSNAMNGTCYTQEECSNLSGTASGTCAEGYGVCCVLTIACGESTSENGTFLSQIASTTPATDTADSQSCTYTICPRTTSVSRIRLDLTTFIIADPFQTSEDGDATNGATASFAVGKCTQDSFSVTGAPVICGVNTGQHMIVDSDGLSCVTATFSYGAGTSSRSYTIQATQFESTNEMGGPAGCLQFYTGLTGTVNTFNWDAAATSTHLANQHYDVCVRPAVDRCHICWEAAVAGATITIRGSFGISNAGAASDTAGQSGVGAACPTVAASITAVAPITSADSDDFILIPNGQSATDVVSAAVMLGNNKFCGRFLAPTNAATANTAVCSRVKPFTLTVSFDDFEAQQTAAASMAKANEASGVTGSASPLATQGFSLNFAQNAC